MSTPPKASTVFSTSASTSAGFAAKRLDLRHGILGPFVTGEIVDRHIRTFRGQLDSAGASDVARPTGDDCGFTLDLHSLSIPFLWAYRIDLGRAPSV
jgi:hypothetical protein